MAPTSHVLAAANAAIALKMLEERGRGAVLLGVARVDTSLEPLLQAAMARLRRRLMDCSWLIVRWAPSAPRWRSPAVGG